MLHCSAVSQGLSHTAQGVATQGGGRGLGRDNSARSRSRAGSYAPRWQPQAPGQAEAWPVMATKYAYLGCTHTGWTAGGRASTESAAQAIPQGCMLPGAPLTESDAGSQTGILCYTAETPCPGAISHFGTRLIGVGTLFAAPPEAHPKRRHRNDGDDIAWRIEPSQLELVRTLPHRPRRSLWAGGPSDNG